MSLFRDIVSGDPVLVWSSPKEILKGLVYEIESKMVTVDDFLADMGVPREEADKPDEPEDPRADLFYKLSLVEWPLSKGEVETYIDRFTARVVEAWEKEKQPEKAAFIRDNIHLLKEYLFDSSRLPTLGSYMGSHVVFPCEGVGHIVFSDHSSPSHPPKFLFLAYGLQLQDDCQVRRPPEGKITNSHKRKITEV